MKIECPRCGEQVEYSPGAVRACAYCKVNLQLPQIGQLPETLRQEWQREQAAAQAREEKRRKKLELAERRNTEKLRQAAAASPPAARREEPGDQEPARAPRPANRAAGPPGSKGFRARIAYALDLKFERYITPQIIRLVWALSLVLALLGVSIYALGGLQAALPRRVSVHNPRPDEVLRREAVIAALIAEKEFAHRMAESRADERPRPQQPPPVAADEEPRSERERIRNEYGKLSVEELRARLVKLEEEYPSYRLEWVFQQTLLYPLLVAAAIVSAVLALLAVRIVCEFLCVVFNIAAHLAAIRQSLPVLLLLPSLALL